MKTLALKGYIRAQLAKSAMNERGATAVEYGLLVALIAVVIIGAVFLLGGTLRDTFSEVEVSMTAVPPAN